MTNTTHSRTIALGLTTALCLTAAIPAVGLAATNLGPDFLYEGSGTVVTGIDNDGSASTVTDSGGVVCEDVDGDGTPDRGRGGTCIPFEAVFDAEGPEGERANAVHVADREIPDDELAFQVCVDLDGSRTCGGPQQADDECRDLIRYSHDTDTGEVFNPLFVSPEEIRFLWHELGCKANGGFPGFVVITCAGVHAHVDEDDGNGTGPAETPVPLQPTHTHQVTEGIAQPAFTEDRGQGDYCGAPPPGGFGQEATQPSREKFYRVE